MQERCQALNVPEMLGFFAPPLAATGEIRQESAGEAAVFAAMGFGLMSVTDTSPVGEIGTAEIRAARHAVSGTFLVFGLLFGLWFTHIPLLAQRHALEPGILGLALLMLGLGTTFAPPIAALIVRWIGLRAMCQVMPFVCTIWVLAPLFAPNVPLLFAAALSFGVIAGLLNVAINTEGAEVEKARGRPTMSSFHGFFSLGGLIGAALWGPMFSAGLGDGRGAAAVTVVLLLGLVWAVRGFLPDRPRQEAESKAARRGGFGGIPLLGLALIGLICTAVEGSVGDWSGLFLVEVKQSDPALASAGYAMFALAMTASRFAGNSAVARLGDKRILVLGGLLMAAGMAIVVFAPLPLLSAAGYLLVGVGAANASPVLISAASRFPGIDAAMGVALVSSAISTGLLAGPPVIGFVAQLLGLPAAMAVVGALGLVVAAGAAVRTWAPQPGTSPA